MTLVPMRFKDYEWRYNPEEISFKCEKNMKELCSPKSTAYIQDLGRKNKIISGKGQLCGEDCLEQFEKLWEVFEQGGVGVLALPYIKPVYAVFEELVLLSEPVDNMITYRFVFREAMEYEKEEKQLEYITKEGDCLWDVSYICKVEIEKLIELNPWIKTPDEMMYKGKVIKLC